METTIMHDPWRESSLGAAEHAEALAHQELFAAWKVLGSHPLNCSQVCISLSCCFYALF